MPYSKLIQSGNYAELYQYEKEPQPKRLRTVFTQRKREELTIDQSLQKRLDNVVRARRNFFRLIHANLKSNDKPIFITLTTVNEKSVVIAYTYLTEFITRLRKIYGAEFRYIAVPEYQKRGAVHFHCIFWGLPLTDIFHEIPWSAWLKIKPKVRERFLAFCNEHNYDSTTARGTRHFQHQWARGFLDCVPTDGSPKLATYMAKYMFKTMSDRRLYQSKSYVCGRNTLRPVSTKISPFDDLINLIVGDEPPVKVSKYQSYLGECTYSVYDDSQVTKTKNEN
jgi:hypothetical protein